MHPKQPCDPSSLAAEVAALRRRVTLYGRLLVAGAGLALFVPVAPAFAPLQSPTADVVAESITLVGPNGETRGEWFGQEDGASGIRIYDEQGRQRAEFSVDREGTPAVVLYDEDEARRLLINVQEGEPSLFLIDRFDQTRVLLDQTDVGSGLFVLGDNDDLVLQVSVDSEGRPGMSLHDPTGARRFLVNVEAFTAAAMFYDSRGEVILELP